jgi:hypothetical protein
MYRKDVNEHSPLRVFEKSMHGGLGRGNVGVVLSRAGVGKTPMLVQIALDDLMRDRKVLHISHEQAADHVRAYYDEIFHDLAVLNRLENVDAERLDIERHRQIYSLLQQPKGPATTAKILETVNFARDVAHFEPDVVIIDGFDFAHATDDAVDSLHDLARERGVEMWISATASGTDDQAPACPPTLERHLDNIAVVVFLEAEKNTIRLRLLKDHDSKDVADLHLRLDPHSMRVIDEDVPAAGERSVNPRQFRLFSGGGRGAEAAFGEAAEAHGIAETNFSFDGHRMLERKRGVVVLSEGDLKKGDFSLVYASRRLDRILSEIPLIRNVLQIIWHQVSNASQVFVIGVLQPDGTVKGGTGWGAELARLWRKPLFVFDQKRNGWFKWSGTAWEIAHDPKIESESFAGLGTQDLSDEGRKAIFALYERSFGKKA